MNNNVILIGNAQQQLNVSSSAAQTPVLSIGLYDVWANVDIYIKVGTTATDVTSNNGYLIRAGETLANINILRDDHKIGAISSISGVMSYHKVR